MLSEIVVRRCSVNMLLLNISQNLRENTCARVSFFNKVAGWPATLLKKRLLHRCFPIKFAKLLRAFFYRTLLVAALYCEICVFRDHKMPTQYTSYSYHTTPFTLLNKMPRFNVNECLFRLRMLYFMVTLPIILVITRFGILDLRNRVTQNDVTPRVTNSKFFIEILLSSY